MTWNQHNWPILCLVLCDSGCILSTAWEWHEHEPYRCPWYVMQLIKFRSKVWNEKSSSSNWVILAKCLIEIPGILLSFALNLLNQVVCFHSMSYCCCVSVSNWWMVCVYHWFDYLLTLVEEMIMAPLLSLELRLCCYLFY